MARSPRAKASDDGPEKPDFDKAVRLYRGDIKPALARAAEFNQEAGTAYKAIKKDARVNRGAAKMAFQLVEMEYEKQQEWLRCFQGMLGAMNIGLDPDLFADGEATNVVPLKPAAAQDLVTVQ